MSHTVTIKSSMKNQKHIFSAAKELGLKVESVTNRALFDGKKFTGTAVYLPQWRYPIIIEEDGTVRSDNYGGAWGAKSELDRFKDHYALADVKAKLDMQVRLRKIKPGYKVQQKNGKIVITAEAYA